MNYAKIEVQSQNNNSKKNKKRSELEKELGVQRNQKIKGIIPNITEAEMNQLNYYNEIAKLNTHGILNNPTLKDIIRITSDESCLDQLKAKLQSKDLPKILESLPLVRVERINYKNIEIGQMRQKLQSNYNNGVDKEKGKQFANNIFSKRLKEGGKYTPVKPIDDLYGENNKLNEEQQILKIWKKNKNNNEIWTKKYKQGNTIQVRKNRDIRDNMKEDEEKIKKNNNDKIIINKNIDKSEKDEDNMNDISPIEKQKYNTIKQEKDLNRDNNNNKNVRNSYKLKSDNNHFYSRNKVNSLKSFNTDNQSFNSMNKINRFSQLNKESNVNENINDAKLRKHHMHYNSNLDIKNTKIIPDKEPIIKININKRLKNANDKNVNIKNDERKSLTNMNDIPGFYSKVRVKRNYFNKEK